MNLNFDNWKYFKVETIFDIHPTKTYKNMSKEDFNDGGKTPVIVNSAMKNGVGAFSTLEPTEKGGIITFSDTTEGNTFFYQSADFIGFSHVQGMYPREHKMTKNQSLFIITMLVFDNNWRFNYGRKMRRDTLLSSYIYLPAINEYTPDWQFMEDYINSIHHKKPSTINKDSNFTVRNWKSFKFGDYIGEIYKAHSFTREEVEVEDISANIPYITRTAEDNGTALLTTNDAIDYQFIESGNAITIGDTTATCFYQQKPFVAGDHMIVIRADWLNKYTGMFIVALLNYEGYRYNYGRAYLMEKVKETEILLPQTEEGEPDWKYMEEYIKKLPYGDRI